jgi:hypothetical protein
MSPRRQHSGVSGPVADYDHIIDEGTPPHCADDIADGPFLVEGRNDRCDLRHEPSWAACIPVPQKEFLLMPWSARREARRA